VFLGGYDRRLCPFAVFSDSLMPYKPVRDINDLSNRNHPFMDSVSLWGGSKKAWFVYRLDDDNLLSLSKEYGFNLTLPLSAESRSQLKRILAELKID